MSNVLIQRLCVMFGAPDHTEDPRAYIGELTHLTRTYSEAELNRAADYLIREFRPTSRKPWPSPSEICVACADAREAIRPTPIADPAGKAAKGWTREAVADADRLIRSPLGQRAADEGWVLSLWDFCREKRRLPNDRETYDCRRAAKEFDEAYGSINPGHPCATTLLKLGDAMLAKRDRRGRIAWGEIVGHGKSDVAGDHA